MTELALGKCTSQWLSVNNDVKDVIDEFDNQVLKILALQVSL